MAERRRPVRTIKLPPPAEVHRDIINAFMDSLGYDEKALRHVTSVRINPRRIEVDVRGRADVRMTVTHPIVWEDDD